METSTAMCVLVCVCQRIEHISGFRNACDIENKIQQTHLSPLYWRHV